MSEISSVVVEPGDEEANDIATVSCEADAKQKEEKKRKQMSKEYNRDWYHKHKTYHVCEWVRQDIHMQERPNQTSEEEHQLFCCTHQEGVAEHKWRSSHDLSRSQECNGYMDI